MVKNIKYLNKRREFVKFFYAILQNMYKNETNIEQKYYNGWYDLTYLQNTALFIFIYENKLSSTKKISQYIRRQTQNKRKSMLYLEEYLEIVFGNIEMYNEYFKEKYEKTAYEFINIIYKHQIDRLKKLMSIKYNRPKNISISDVQKKFSIKLRPHQQTVVKYFLETDNRGLFLNHNVGSGKTLTSLATAYGIRMKYGENVPITIITPTSVVNQFVKEAEKIFTDFSNITITTHVKWLNDYNNYKVDAIGHILIVDEIHKFNKLTGTRSQYLRFAAKDAFKLIILSATPIGNDYDELTSYLMMLSGHNFMDISGEKLINDYFKINTDQEVSDNEFQIMRSKTGLTRSEYGEFKKELEQELENIDNFNRPLKGILNRPNNIKCNFSFFNRKTEDYPDKKEHIVYLKMSKEYQKEYNIIETFVIKYTMYKYIMNDKDVSEYFNKSFLEYIEAYFFNNGKKEVLSNEEKYEFFQMLFKKSHHGYMKFISYFLSTAFLHNIRMAATAIEGSSPKIDWVINHVTQRFKKKEKVLLYSNWINLAVNGIEDRLQYIPGLKYASITGSISKKNRSDIIKQFNNDKIDVLIISSAGAEGMDLKKTRSIVIIEPHWNRSRIDQIIGRGVRYKSHEGMPKKDQLVDIYHLLMEKDYNYIDPDKPKSVKKQSKTRNKKKHKKKQKKEKELIDLGLKLTADILLFYISLKKDVKVKTLSNLINYFSIERNQECFNINKTKY